MDEELKVTSNCPFCGIAPQLEYNGKFYRIYHERSCFMLGVGLFANNKEGIKRWESRTLAAEIDVEKVKESIFDCLCEDGISLRGINPNDPSTTVDYCKMLAEAITTKFSAPRLRLPEEKDMMKVDHSVEFKTAYALGWNDCRKEICRLNNLPEQGGENG